MSTYSYALAIVAGAFIGVATLLVLLRRDLRRDRREWARSERPEWQRAEYSVISPDVQAWQERTWEAGQSTNVVLDGIAWPQSPSTVERQQREHWLGKRRLW